MTSFIIIGKKIGDESIVINFSNYHDHLAVKTKLAY